MESFRLPPMASLLPFLMAAWVALRDSRHVAFVLLSLRCLRVVWMVIQRNRVFETILQLILATFVAYCNFPDGPTAIQFHLVTLVAFINIHFIGAPLLRVVGVWVRFLISTAVAPRQSLRAVWRPSRKHRRLPPRGETNTWGLENRFHQFAWLPEELRVMIWIEALPHRAVELNKPDFAVNPTECTFRWTSRANNSPPAIASVSKEARKVAFDYCTLESDMERADSLPRPTIPVPLWFWAIHPLVFPNARLTWFDKAKDTVLLYHSPYWESRSAWSALRARIVLYGYLAANTAVFAASVNPWPRCSQHHYQHVLASGPAVPWQDPIFVLKIVVIHVTVVEARRSGLFGLVGDEQIQLVDPWDSNLIMDYFHLTRGSFHEQGQDTVAFFDGFRDNVGRWDLQVGAWVRDGLTRELWMAWMAEYHYGFPSISYPGEVFNGPTRRNGHELDMTDPASYQTTSTGGPIDLDQYGPNDNHPWVVWFLGHLPTFRPRLQFRHCANNCVPDPNNVS